MGFPVPSNSPQFTANGQTYCVAGFVNPNPAIDDIYMFGLFAKQPDGSWNQVQVPVQYVNSGGLVADIKAKGGMDAYLVWLKAQINAAMAKFFGAQSADPTTDAQSMAVIQAAIAGWVVSGTQIK